MPLFGKQALNENHFQHGMQETNTEHHCQACGTTIQKPELYIKLFGIEFCVHCENKFKTFIQPERNWVTQSLKDRGIKLTKVSY